MRIFPSGCNATARMVSSGPVPGSKVVSKVPFVLSLAIRASRPSCKWNEPIIIMRPSVRNVTTSAKPLGKKTEKVLSRLPFVLSRRIWLLRESSASEIRIFPSGWSAGLPTTSSGRVKR